MSRTRPGLVPSPETWTALIRLACSWWTPLVFEGDAFVRWFAICVVIRGNMSVRLRSPFVIGNRRSTGAQRVTASDSMEDQSERSTDRPTRIVGRRRRIRPAHHGAGCEDRTRHLMITNRSTAAWYRPVMACVPDQVLRVSPVGPCRLVSVRIGSFRDELPCSPSTPPPSGSVSNSVSASGRCCGRTVRGMAAWTSRNPSVARSGQHRMASRVVSSTNCDRSGADSSSRAGRAHRQISVELEGSKANRIDPGPDWDRDWRRSNGHHTSPEDQLWRAATAVTELEDALGKSND